MSIAAGSLSSDFLVSKLGYCNPFIIVGSVLTSIGAGLMTTPTPSTGDPQWVGYQIVFGPGAGFSTNQ